LAEEEPVKGLRVIALESRRAEEMAALIRKQGGEAFVAPSMREVELTEQSAALEFGGRMLAGEFDCLILLTGVGARILWKAVGSDQMLAAWKKVTLVARGPKPAAALRELGLAANVLIRAPNTWHEIVEAMKDRAEKKLALQEYGKTNPALIEALQQQARSVSPVSIYGWDLPSDTGPLKEAARRIAAGDADMVLFTTSMQVVNLMRMGDPEELARGLNKTVVASIGPTTSETLQEYGIRVDFEPSQAKMGLLVNEAANYNKRLRS
jgi:uroporphyrinogen-III synthase